MTHFEFRQCEWAECRFRYPMELDESRGARCPLCGSATQVVTRVQAPEEQPAPRRPKRPLQGLLDNIRSIHNVGSMFRTADGAGLAHLYLCGMTATPAHPKLAKAALGAQEKVPWSYSANGLETAERLKRKGCALWAIELAPAAQPFFEVLPHPADEPVILVVGNERAGVDPEILALCERVYALPMGGSKRSLNVAVAFGIVSYNLVYLAQPASSATP